MISCYVAHFITDLYTLSGRLMTVEDELWTQSRSVLRWPKTKVPRKWMGEWYEKIGSIFSERRESVRWVDRESVAEISSDGERVKLRGVWYVKNGRGKRMQV